MNETSKRFDFKKLKVGRALMYVFLIVVAVIQIYPLIWMLFFSLKDNSEIYGGNVMGLPHHFLIQNYITAFTDGMVGLYTVNSVIVTGATILLTTIVSCMAAYAIERMRWKFSNTVLMLILLGLMIPIHATLLPLFIFFSKVRLLNTYWCLILPYVGFAMPMAVYIFTGFVKGIPKEMEESALLDGCNIFGAFFRIILPMMRPAIATVAIFTFLSAWNELMFAITFISKTGLKTLTVGIQQMVGQYTTNWGALGAGLVIATIPTLIIYILMSKQVQSSLVTGAVKE